MTPRLEPYPNHIDRFIMRTEFKQAFIDDFKDNIWWQCREWQKGPNAWVVDISFLEECRRLLKKHYGGVDVHKGLLSIIKRNEEEGLVLTETTEF